MKFGMNLLLWGTEIDESLFPVLEKIKEIGFDGVEVPLFDVKTENWKSWRKKLDELGLDRVAVTINGPNFNAISQDPLMRIATLAQNKRALDCAAVLGSKFLTGPYHSALGVFTGKPATEEEWGWALDHIRQLADYAATLDITLGLEYLNRFESYLFTCTDDMLRFVSEVDRPNCKVMFDTFHANIEEKSMPEAIKKCGDTLIHVQLSENDRATLGHGHTNFPEIVKALDTIGYEGMLSIEAFSMKLTAANIWRKMFESEEQLMRDSLNYLKNITTK